MGLAETSLPSLPAASALNLPLPGAAFGRPVVVSSQADTIAPPVSLQIGSIAPREPRQRDSKAEVRRARRYAGEFVQALNSKWKDCPANIGSYGLTHASAFCDQWLLQLNDQSDYMHAGRLGEDLLSLTLLRLTPFKQPTPTLLSSLSQICLLSFNPCSCTHIPICCVWSLHHCLWFGGIIARRWYNAVVHLPRFWACM